jgi:hypothetical protein
VSDKPKAKVRDIVYGADGYRPPRAVRGKVRLMETVSETGMLNPAGRSKLSEIGWGGIGVVVAALVLGATVSLGGFRYGDSAVHAMDGVLILDWLRGGPGVWLQPLAFADQQYGHYPALGIGQHYPPAFAVVEAAFFAILGVSITTARVCVVFFGLIATAGTYVFARRWMGRLPSTLAAVSLATMPAFVTWGRQVMLEVPTLAALIWAGVAFNAYLDQPTRRRLLLAHMLASIAILFKQPAVFLNGTFFFVVCGLVFLRRANPRHAVVSGLVSMGVTLAVFWSLDDLGRQVVSGYANQIDGAGWNGVFFYAKQMPRIVGATLLTLGVVGLALSFRRSMALGLLLLGWFGACYVMLSVVDCKNPRFLCLGIFPFSVWGALVAETALRHIPKPRPRYLAFAAAALALSLRGMTQPIDLEPDYGQTVSTHRDKIQGQAILFGGIRDGDFVFAVREQVPWRTSVVVRASKLFYTCNAVPEIDFVSKASTPLDIQETIRRYAFRYIFVERANRSGVPQDRMLREYLTSTPDYRLIDSDALTISGGQSSRQRILDVYEAVNDWTPTESRVDIYIPRSRRTILMDLSAHRRTAQPKTIRKIAQLTPSQEVSLP